VTFEISQAMVFAAGFGKRLRPITNHTPKPLIPIRGTTCLGATLTRLQNIGVKKIVVNAHHLADQVIHYVKPWPNIQVIYEPILLETGGGFLNALPYFDVTQPILTVNSDVWFDDGLSSDCFESLSKSWQRHMKALLLVVAKTNAIGFDGPGDYFLENGLLVHRGENPQATFVYAGAQLISPQAFLSFKSGSSVFSMRAVWDFFEADKNALHGLEYKGKWCDVGTPMALGCLQSEKALTATLPLS
jgi:N-acetyl-alpha-D-muramate 1-phosphate uridylyltransferase